MLKPSAPPLNPVPYRVLIAAGGTAGHIFPARQLKEDLEGAQVIFAGHKLATNPFFEPELHAFFEVASGGTLKAFHRILFGIWQSVRVILRVRPEVVVGFGSYHSFPVLLAAALLRKKMVLFEANCSLGKVNRWFSPFAKKIAFQFSPMAGKKVVYVPLLPWRRRQTVKKYEKDPEKFTILVFGGSQGAAFINETFPQAAHLLSFPIQVIHFTGKTKSLIKYSVPNVVAEFEADMHAAYTVADIVVCRSGASTVAELIQYQKPAVVIPYPYAYAHQRKNGEFLGKGAIVLAQEEATPERLSQAIGSLRENLEKHKEALRKMVFLPTISLAEIVKQVARGV